MPARTIFVTGGVVSSLGKGLAAAATAACLQARGLKVRLRKLDPYLNVDPGTMSPTQHGEVFVTEDGAETDLDLGHYERFTGVPARRTDSVTTGQIYWQVLTRERRGDYLGATVQVIPHVTDAIKAAIHADAADSDIDDTDVVICEIGGTVGDIEGLPFLEAIRQFANDVGRENCLFLHLTLLPWIESAGEMKTKPTQHSVKDLLGHGIQADILLCRSGREIDRDTRRKLALFCNIRPEAVIPALDVDTIYAVPQAYQAAGLDREICRRFGFQTPEPDLSAWTRVVDRIRRPDGRVTVGIVGKYTSLSDSYKSLLEALIHAGVANNVGVDVRWIDAEALEADTAAEALRAVDAILVPGGFGKRGSEGKIAATRFARECGVPYLGICLGMQMAVVEAARNLVGLVDAGSPEFGEPGDPVVGLMADWASDDKGGTMRLGAYPADLAPDSRIAAVYGARTIRERHRHRYEVNPAYAPALEAAGLRVAGWSPDGRLPETVEVADHPFYIGVQFHPEFGSRPFAPHPLFVAFVAAALAQARLA